MYYILESSLKISTPTPITEPSKMKCKCNLEDIYFVLHMLFL